MSAATPAQPPPTPLRSPNGNHAELPALSVPPEFIEAVAERVAELLAEHAGRSDPWLNVEQAAEHIGAPKSRLYALVSARRIPFAKDGSRVLFKRSELDTWVRQGGGVRP
jgi:excisionase family DNA binding protein